MKKKILEASLEAEDFPFSYRKDTTQAVPGPNSLHFLRMENGTLEKNPLRVVAANQADDVFCHFNTDADYYLQNEMRSTRIWTVGTKFYHASYQNLSVVIALG